MLTLAVKTNKPNLKSNIIEIKSFFHKIESLKSRLLWLQFLALPSKKNVLNKSVGNLVFFKIKKNWLDSISINIDLILSNNLVQI